MSSTYHLKSKHLKMLSKVSSLYHISSTLGEFPPSPQHLAAVHGKQQTLWSLDLRKLICFQKNPYSSSEPWILFITKLRWLFPRGCLSCYIWKEMGPGSLQVLGSMEVVVVSSTASSNEPNLLPPFSSGRSLGAFSSFVHNTLSRAHSFTSNIIHYKNGSKPSHFPNITTSVL